MNTECPIPEGALDMVAHRFAVLGEPMRLRLLKALFDGEKNVTALVEQLGASQSNVSRHLQTLTAAGIIDRRKEGLEVIYFVTDRSIFNLCEVVCGSLEKQVATALVLGQALRILQVVPEKKQPSKAKKKAPRA